MSSRRFTRQSFAWILTLAAAVAPATAAPAGGVPPHAYVVQGAARSPDKALPVGDAVESFDVRVDTAVIAANPEVLTVDLPNVGLLEAVRNGFVRYRADWQSWSGTLRRVGEEGAGGGYVSFGVHGDQLSGVIDFDGERYRIVGKPDGGQSLVRLAADSGAAPCGMTDELGDGFWELTPAPSEEPAPNEQPTPKTRRRVVAADTVWCPVNGATYQIDLLVVYPREFFGLSAYDEEQIRYLVEAAVGHANSIFFNSKVRASYNLRGVVPLIGAAQPPAEMRAALDWMTANAANGHNTAAEVAALRNAFAADVVVLYVPQNWNAGEQPVPPCGFGNLPVADPVGGWVGGGGWNNPRAHNPPRPDFGDRAFSVNRWGCGLADFTLAHEIGHNLGMRHHESFDPSSNAPHIYPNGRGYNFPPAPGAPTRADVMGCVWDGADCNRIPYFSDPEADPSRPAGLQHAGAIGNATHNARGVACAEVQRHSGFRTPPNPPNQPPVPSFTVSCTGMTCTFNGLGSRDYQTYVQSWSWDFGDGQVATGYQVEHTYQQEGARRVHLVVTDSQGQTAVTWDTANPHVPQYEGFLEVANCRNVSGWAWDRVTPNTPIDVDIYRDWQLQARIPANLYRPDLQSAGIGNGYHAFVYQPYWWQDGQWHWIYARYAGTYTDLWWSPRQVICGVSMFPWLTPSEPNLPTGGQVYSVGTQFSSNIDGYITELGFYRAPSESGNNRLHLYTDWGMELGWAQAYCWGGGWCWADLYPDVAISANTTYRVTVNTNNAQAKTGCGIGGGLSNQNLTAHSGFWEAGDTFPHNGSCSNFFVDVKFDM